MSPQASTCAWRQETIALAADSYQTKIYTANTPLTFSDVLHLWQDNPIFQAFWTQVLQAIPFEAYCWENPALTLATLSQPFECVFVNNPALAITQADARPFAEHFQKNPDSAIACFENLGGDARLLAPCPQADDPSVYSHLAVFVRQAPKAQVMALWPAVAAAVRARVGKHPLWLSTAGLGVYWLHMRLDTQPKYYRHRPYQNAGS